jgi:hypothetical protein
MKILHNQSQLKKILFLGIGYVIIGLLSLLTSSSNIFLSGSIGIGIVFISQYFYNKNRAYVILTENSIMSNGIIKKEIEIKNVKSIKYFAGDYIIKSAEKEIVIDTNLVDKESLSNLKNYFENLKFEK